MTTLDHRIRSLVHDRVAESPTPLTAAELEARWHAGVTPAERTHRRVWPVLIAVAAAAATVVTVVVLDRHTDHPTDRVDRPVRRVFRDDQILLPSIPDGWVPVDVSDGTEFGVPGREVTLGAAAFRRADGSGLLDLRVQGPMPGGDPAFELADGAQVTWQPDCGGWMCIDVVWADQSVEARVTGVDATDEAVRRLAEAISIGDDGIPQVDASTGFRPVRSGLLSVGSGAQLDVVLFRADTGDGFITFDATAGTYTSDAALAAGAFATERVVGGQSYWVTDGTDVDVVTWSRNGAMYTLSVSPPEGTVFDLLPVATSAYVATWDDVHDVSRLIGSTAPLKDSAEMRIGGRTLKFEERSLGSETYGCLVTDDDHRCDHVYESDFGSFLLEGRWYVITQSHAQFKPEAVAEEVVVGRDDWHVALIPAEADSVNLVDEAGKKLGLPLNRPML